MEDKRTKKTGKVKSVLRKKKSAAIYSFFFSIRSLFAIMRPRQNKLAFFRRFGALCPLALSPSLSRLHIYVISLTLRQPKRRRNHGEGEASRSQEVKKRERKQRNKAWRPRRAREKLGGWKMLFFQLKTETFSPLSAFLFMRPSTTPKRRQRRRKKQHGGGGQEWGRIWRGVEKGGGAARNGGGGKAEKNGRKKTIVSTSTLRLDLPSAAFELPRVLAYRLESAPVQRITACASARCCHCSHLLLLRRCPRPSPPRPRPPRPRPSSP